MSQFLGANTGFGASGMLVPVDEQVMPKYHKWDGRADVVQTVPWQQGNQWSSSKFTGGAGGWGGPFLDDMDGPTSQWDVELRYTGGQQAKKIIGTTRDSSGVAKGSCIVRGFLTATNAFVGQVTSDTGGYFELPTPNVGAHYLVAFQGGSPDQVGTTDNTLIPV